MKHESLNVKDALAWLNRQFSLEYSVPDELGQKMVTVSLAPLVSVPPLEALRIILEAANLTAVSDGGIWRIREKPDKAVTVLDAGGPSMNCILFFDDWMLQAREGLDRVQGQPVLLADVTPELPKHLSRMSFGMSASSMVYDPRVGRYIMYMDCWTAAPEAKRFTVRVESDDPEDWPDLRGKRAAEVLQISGENAVVDENGEPLSRFHIRPLAGTLLADKGYVGIFEQRIGFSPDGVHFQIVPDKRWIEHTDEPGFGLVYDPWGERYIIYGRIYGVDRRVGRVITTDFESFSSPEIALQPDALDPICREFYEMYNVRYEDMFVGCLWIFDTELTETAIIKMHGTKGTQLTYSYDGEHWYRAFREMFIGRGGAGTPTGGMVTGATPIRAPDDRLIVPAMGAWGGHSTVEDAELNEQIWKMERCLVYELRLDGFAYLETRARDGLIRTKALITEGDELTLNVRTSRNGYVKVQVLDAVTFEPLPHYTLEEAIPITGDHLFAKAQWQDRDNIAEFKGRPVMLEVHVREGELYSLRVPFKAFYTSWLAHRI